MSELISNRPMSLPAPRVPIAVRVATLTDVPFIDALQKRQTKQVGWMPTKQLEGKIAAGHVLVAETNDVGRDGNPAESSNDGIAISPYEKRVGYLIGNDQYFKRDDVGIIYQINVLLGRQRGLIGASLLKAQFERSAYGCKLYCCWCAQDIEANQFWEAMGFVPLAFRTGGKVRMKAEGGRMKREKTADPAGPGSSFIPQPSSLPHARVHIFWQKRIRSGDGTTPWWFPSKTAGGSIREDRIVLPIPPGTHWSDAKPLIYPEVPAAGATGGTPPVLSNGDAIQHGRRTARGTRASSVVPPTPSLTACSGLRFAPSKPLVIESPMEKPKRERKPKLKNDPRLEAAARELRDRWLEQVNASGTALPEARGKYDVCRSIAASGGREARHALHVQGAHEARHTQDAQDIPAYGGPTLPAPMTAVAA